MTIEEVTAILEKVKDRVTGQVRNTVKKILAISRDYSGLGTQFTFYADADLDKEVNNLLIQLSDAIIEDTENYAIKTVDEEDKEDVVPYVTRTQGDKDLTERVDSHSSHLRYLLEGYLAVCFADKLTDTDILGNLVLYLTNPYGYARMREAFNDWQKYRSDIIRARGFHFGRGTDTNPIGGFTVTEQNGINEGFQWGRIMKYRRNPKIIGYRVHRGSGYDCQICDDLCKEIHPVTEIVLPAHARCRCYTTPVYKDEM